MASNADGFQKKVYQWDSVYHNPFFEKVLTAAACRGYILLAFITTWLLRHLRSLMLRLLLRLNR